jgi:ATP-dependent RNA helicase DOB1
MLLQQIVKRFPKGVPLLNPETDMKIKENAFTSIVELINTYEQRLFSHPMHEKDELEDVYEQYLEKVKVTIASVGRLHFLSNCIARFHGKLKK